MDDDYTLVSSKDVSELKQDVDFLKKNPLGSSKSSRSLQESVDKLNENIEELIEIFKEASEQMKAEERESDVIVKRIAPIEAKLDELSDQNQKIAKGILAVADMVNSREEKPRMMMSRPAMPPQRPMMMQKPMNSQPSKLPPMGGMPPQNSSMGLPPLPPKKEEKKGLFGLMK